MSLSAISKMYPSLLHNALRKRYYHQEKSSLTICVQHRKPYKLNSSPFISWCVSAAEFNYLIVIHGEETWVSYVGAEWAHLEFLFTFVFQLWKYLIDATAFSTKTTLNGNRFSLSSWPSCVSVLNHFYFHDNNDRWIFIRKSSRKQNSL